VEIVAAANVPVPAKTQIPAVQSIDFHTQLLRLVSTLYDLLIPRVSERSGKWKEVNSPGVNVAGS
jgi:hypothetical protein